HQYPDSAFFKCVDRIDASILTFVCMDDPYIVRAVSAFEKPEDAVGYGFCLAKNNEAVQGFVVFKQVLEQVDLCLQVGHIIERLHYGLCGRGLFGYLHDGWKSEEITRDFVYQLPHRR